MFRKLADRIVNALAPDFGDLDLCMERSDGDAISYELFDRESRFEIPQPPRRSRSPLALAREHIPVIASEVAMSRPAQIIAFPRPRPEVLALAAAA